MAVLTATGLAAALAHALPLQAVGSLLLACAFYVALSFFLPLPLPPVRDEELIEQRRSTPEFAQIERQMVELRHDLDRHRLRRRAIRHAIRTRDFSQVEAIDKESDV